MRKFIILTSLVGCAFLFAQFKADNTPLKIFPKNLRENFAWIPGGNVVIGQDTTQVESFFATKNEVSQAEYALFLNAIKMSDDANRIRIASIDSAKWNTVGEFMTPYTTYYHSHPAYRNYPVVNIGYDAALLYCVWFEEQLEKQMGGEFNVKVTLPTRSEWIRAARGDQHYFKYAWGGPALHNAKGTVLCNYSNIGDEAISRNPISNQYEVKKGESGNRLGVAGYLSDNADILAPVNAYSSNQFGLKNMNGNASEMTIENGLAVGGSWRDPGYDVRNESASGYTGPSPDLGFRPIIRLEKK
jgi:formylglycine-generating enzyme required for sulfatase activity